MIRTVIDIMRIANIKRSCANVIRDKIEVVRNVINEATL